MKKLKNNRILSITIMMVVMLVFAIGYEAIFCFNDTAYEITVTDKERIYEGNGDSSSSKYLVFCDDENGNSIVFENTDCFIRGKWNSSNIQGELKEGNTYRITVVGYRVPFLSMYQNIIGVESINQ